jgi:hypothetical protein
MRWVLVLALAASWWSCTDDATLDATQVAQVFCDCIAPGATTACVGDLAPELAMGSATCTTCVEQFETDCTLLQANCETPCTQQEMIDGTP